MRYLTKALLIKRLTLLHPKAFNPLIANIKLVNGDVTYSAATRAVKETTSNPMERTIYFAAINKAYEA